MLNINKLFNADKNKINIKPTFLKTNLNKYISECNIKYANKMLQQKNNEDNYLDIKKLLIKINL